MWQDIEGHDAIVERFRATLACGRLASTYLFVGPDGVGKRLFALRLAQSLLCDAATEADLNACGQCDTCRQVSAGTHPDVIQVSRPADKNVLPVELFIGDHEHRMQHGLCHDIALRPFSGRRKIAVIDDADLLNQEAANALLKTLEEPPPGALLILIGTSASRQLPTIRSRSQIVRFQPLEGSVIADWLLRNEVVADRPQAETLAELADGSLAAAVELAESELYTFRDQLIEHLSAPVMDSARTAQMVSEFVDAAGREASDRRGRLRQVIAVAAEYYRHLMRTAAGAAARVEPRIAAAVDRVASAGSVDVDWAAARVDRCLQALVHVDRFANQSTLIACWLDDLSR